MTDVRIALDAMGGDHAPGEIVRGALLAAAEYPVAILLVGQEEVIRRELGSKTVPSNVSVVDAREVVGMDDTALAPLRKKRNSSIRICANLVGKVARSILAIYCSQPPSSMQPAKSISCHSAVRRTPLMTEYTTKSPPSPRLTR